jgi:hypothetical protein
MLLALYPHAKVQHRSQWPLLGAGNVPRESLGVGPQQHTEKTLKDSYKHQYFGLNRPVFMQKLSD